MGQPYVGEIRMFGGNFAPAGWAFCNGQLLPISENEVLFTLIGTTYGGDGQNTFALPDLRGRLPIHQGTGPGLSSYVLGQSGGSEEITLTNGQIPTHTHALLGSSGAPTSSNPQGNVTAQPTTFDFYSSDPPTSTMNTSIVSSTGGSQPHDNMMPFLCVSFIISLYGIYPSQ